MTAHSMFAPSAAHRWSACTASVKHVALRGINVDTEAAREGTAAHEFLAAVIQTGEVLSVASNGVEITEAMREGAALALETVTPYLDGLLSEIAVPIPRVAPEAFGTVDLCHFDMATFTLRIWDYKYGWGIVEPFENPQLIAYYAGLADHFRIDGAKDQVLNVELGILQPRPYHPEGKVRIWKTTGGELRAYVNRLANAAAEASGPSPRYAYGGHCRNCPARHDCPLLGAAADLQAATWTAAPMLPPEAQPVDLGNELAALEDAAAVIEARASGLRAAIETHLRAGRSVPGWGIESKPGRAKWSVSDEEVIEFGKALGVDLSVLSAITPAQAKKKGINAELLGSISERGSSTSLARVTTKNLERVFNRHG